MQTNYDVCIVIPAFNEEVGIKGFLLKLNDTLKEIQMSYMISVVDDGSADNTWAELKALQSIIPESLTASRFSRNFGKDAAVFAAIESVNANAYIIMDADGQHPLELIGTFIRMWKDGNYDIINGVKQFGENASLFRRTFSRIFNYLFQKMSGMSLMNSTDFKLINRKVAEEILKCGDYYIFFRALTTWVGFKQTDIEFQIKKRDAGTGKWPTTKLIIYAVNAILLYSYVPLYILLSFGLLALVLSIFLFVKLLILYFMGEVPSGYSTLLVIMLLTMSMNLISVGIIGLYLQKVLDQVKFRPRYIIMDKI